MESAGGLQSAQPKQEGKRRTEELCDGMRVDVCARCGAHNREQQATHVVHERTPVHVQPKPAREHAAHPGVGEDLEAEVVVDEEKDGKREGGVGEQGDKAHGGGERSELIAARVL